MNMPKLWVVTFDPWEDCEYRSHVFASEKLPDWEDVRSWLQDLYKDDDSEPDICIAAIDRVDTVTDLKDKPFEVLMYPKPKVEAKGD